MTIHQWFTFLEISKGGSEQSEPYSIFMARVIHFTVNGKWLFINLHGL